MIDQANIDKACTDKACVLVTLDPVSRAVLVFCREVLLFYSALQSKN